MFWTTATKFTKSICLFLNITTCSLSLWWKVTISIKIFPTSTSNLWRNVWCNHSQSEKFNLKFLNFDSTPLILEAFLRNLSILIHKYFINEFDWDSQKVFYRFTGFSISINIDIGISSFISFCCEIETRGGQKKTILLSKNHLEASWGKVSDSFRISDWTDGFMFLLLMGWSCSSPLSPTFHIAFHST